MRLQYKTRARINPEQLARPLGEIDVPPLEVDLAADEASVMSED